MRLLFVVIVLCLSLAQAASFRFEPRLELPANTQEYGVNSCIEDITGMGLLAQGYRHLLRLRHKRPVFLVEKLTEASFPSILNVGLLGWVISNNPKMIRSPTFTAVSGQQEKVQC